MEMTLEEMKRQIAEWGFHLPLETTEDWQRLYRVVGPQYRLDAEVNAPEEVFKWALAFEEREAWAARLTPVDIFADWLEESGFPEAGKALRTKFRPYVKPHRRPGL